MYPCQPRKKNSDKNMNNPIRRMRPYHHKTIEIIRLWKKQYISGRKFVLPHHIPASSVYFQYELGWRQQHLPPTARLKSWFITEHMYWSLDKNYCIIFKPEIVIKLLSSTMNLNFLKHYYSLSPQSTSSLFQVSNLNSSKSIHISLHIPNHI